MGGGRPRSQRVREVSTRSHQQGQRLAAGQGDSLLGNLQGCLVAVYPGDAFRGDTQTCNLCLYGGRHGSSAAQNNNLLSLLRG